MTFNIIVPNANQSPGVFPAQNNTNFQRIKEIVNNDHNWTDSAAADEGIHKQATFINRASPGALPFGNGILYSKNDAVGLAQLRWYNGDTDLQMSNGMNLITRGTVSLTTLSVASIFTVPDVSFGTIFMWNTTSFLSAFIQWQSVAGIVSCLQVPAYLGTSSSGTIIPILFTNAGNLELRPKTSDVSFNGTYRYRVFQVP